jgi:ribonucleotide reductase beta subunit family protein with ferritin-like domain
MGDLEGCSKYDLVSFIKHRTNTKMADLGYGAVVNDIDLESIKRMKWFDSLSAGKQHTDFFASRVTNYSKGAQNWDANDLF